MNKHLSVWITWSLLLAFACFSVEACPVELPSSHVTINGHRLVIEVAATRTTRNCGLSHRTSLPSDQGMLFVYPYPRRLSFWMKDTEIPLSIAFLEEDGRILSIQQMVPMQTRERYHSPRPAHYALEVNRGWFAKHGIGVGAVVQGINVGRTSSY